jgi:hypothetical protein
VGIYGHCPVAIFRHEMTYPDDPPDGRSTGITTSTRQNFHSTGETTSYVRPIRLMMLLVIMGGITELAPLPK